MNLRAELVALAERALAELDPADAAVTHVHIAHGRPDADRDAEFGLVALRGGAAGLYYAWLGDSQATMRRDLEPGALAARGTAALLRLFLGDTDAERSIGLAVISAVTDALFRQAGYAPPGAADSLGSLALAAGDRLGMVGNFPPLVRRARALGVDVHVVERKRHMLKREPGLEVTLDPDVLRTCNKIICTGATLLNDSLEAMLGYFPSAARVVLLGPTVGFFPDPLFARGIDAAGGTRVLDARAAGARLAAGGKLGDSAVRTLVERAGYPGFDELLERAVSARAARRSPAPEPRAAR